MKSSSDFWRHISFICFSNVDDLRTLCHSFIIMNAEVKSTPTTQPSTSFITQEYLEKTLLHTILYPFINQFEGIHDEYPLYAWQDFILHVYDECFTPLHNDGRGLKQVVCNALAGLLGLKSRQPTKEQFKLLSLYYPYLSQVPRKITLRRTYSPNERSIFTLHPNNSNTGSSSMYHQIIVDHPSPPPLERQVQIIKPQPRIKKSQPSMSCKRKYEIIDEVEEDDDYEDIEDTEKAGKEVAIADARVSRAICIHNMAVAYHDELVNKIVKHRNVIIPQKKKQIEIYKKQRQEVLAKYKIKE